MEKLYILTFDKIIVNTVSLRITLLLFEIESVPFHKKVLQRSNG